MASGIQVPGWIGKARMAGKYLGPIGNVIGGGLDYADGKAQGEDDIRAGVGAAGSTAGGVAGAVLGSALGPLGTIGGSIVGSTIGGWLGDRADEFVRGNAGVKQTGAPSVSTMEGIQQIEQSLPSVAAFTPEMIGAIKVRRQQDLMRNYYQ